MALKYVDKKGFRNCEEAYHQRIEQQHQARALELQCVKWQEYKRKQLSKAESIEKLAEHPLWIKVIDVPNVGGFDWIKPGYIFPVKYIMTNLGSGIGTLVVDAPNRAGLMFELHFKPGEVSITDDPSEYNKQERKKWLDKNFRRKLSLDD